MFLFLLVPFIHILQFGVSHFSRIFIRDPRTALSDWSELVRTFNFPVLDFSILFSPGPTGFGSWIPGQDEIPFISHYYYLFLITHAKKALPKSLSKKLTRNWKLSLRKWFIINESSDQYVVMAVSHGKCVIKSLKARTFCGMGAIDS